MNIAIITGASSGMGKEFSKQLDSFGFDEIWAFGSNETKLEPLTKEIKTKLRTFALDLTCAKNFQVVEGELKKLSPNVQWLINASGFGKFGRYDEFDTETKINMIDLNCSALVRMTEIVLPYMNNGARIIEIGSVAGFQPTPYISVYAATKAFVISYSRAMNVELKSRGISITCMCPFWTKTPFFDRAKKINSKTNKEVISYYAVMYDPKKVVAKAIKDALKRRELSIYGFVARNQVRLVKLFPHKLVMKVWCKQQKFNKKYLNE